MEPVKFEGQNCTFAENQPEYKPLPAYKTRDGKVVSCWELTFREKLKLLFGFKLFIWISTFNMPLQPLLPIISKDLESTGLKVYE